MPEVETLKSSKQALIFIPDISGYTEFIKSTDIQKSKHIIQELLTGIVDTVNLNLKMSEIEGDAILFYQFSALPTLNEIINQCKAIFIKFHENLSRYLDDPVCQCRQNLSKLTLKFIIHYGDVSVLGIKSKVKLLGVPVIIGHKLLKNNLPYNEYVLFTEGFLSSIPNQTIGPENDWVKLERGHVEYDTLGKVEYTYFLLSPLHSKV